MSDDSDTLIYSERGAVLTLDYLQRVIGLNVKDPFARINIYQPVRHTIGDLQTLNGLEACGVDRVHADVSSCAFEIYERHRYTCGYQVALDDNDKSDASLFRLNPLCGEFSNSVFVWFDVLGELLSRYLGDFGIAFLDQISDLPVELFTQLCFGFIVGHHIGMVATHR